MTYLSNNLFSADDSIVVWTNYNSVNKTTQIYSLPADAERVRQQSSASQKINVSVLVSSSRNATEFWAITSDYQSGNIFFSDYR